MPASTPILAPGIEYEQVAFSREEVQLLVPQRHEFAMLDGVLSYDEENATAVAFKQLSEDDYWVRGHIPGNPLFPGVLMIESAAQLCCFVYSKSQKEDRFFAFGGVNDVRFRGTVRPSDRFLIMAKARKIRKVMGVFETQAFVGEKMVYEGVITGMLLGSSAD